MKYQLPHYDEWNTRCVPYVFITCFLRVSYVFITRALQGCANSFCASPYIGTLPLIHGLSNRDSRMPSARTQGDRDQGDTDRKPVRDQGDTDRKPVRDQRDTDRKPVGVAPGR